MQTQSVTYKPISSVGAVSADSQCTSLTKQDNAEWEAIDSEQIDIEIDTNSTAIYESIEVNNPYNIFGKGLVMASLNVNSLLAHIDELKIFTSANALDVFIINKTKLDSTIDNQEVNIPGYEIIRNDRKINGRKGGGVCIYVRCKITYILRDDLEIEKLESLVIQVNKPRSKPILISTWYRPPDTPTAIFITLRS